MCVCVCLESYKDCKTHIHINALYEYQYCPNDYTTHCEIMHINVHDMMDSA